MLGYIKKTACALLLNIFPYMFRFDIATKSSNYSQQHSEAMSLVYKSYLFILSKWFGK